MIKLHLHRVELPLEHPFTISRGTFSVQHSLIVHLQQGAHHGFGEATQHVYYDVTIDDMVEAIDHCRHLIEGTEYRSPESLWEVLRQPLQGKLFLLSAIDAAAYDLFGKIEGKRTHELLGLNWAGIPVSSFTIGIDTTERMVEKMRERKDWPAFKIKLGTDRDLDIVRQLRQHSSARFRVDANCGWTVDETIEKSAELAAMGVEFIEQPLPAESPDEDHERVMRESSLPIIADESCLAEPDVDRCHGLFHGINVKLAKCGGLTPAVRMLRRARTIGMKTMIGCMVESTIGISAAAQLLPLLDDADLDGAALLAADIADGVRIENGIARLPARDGSGIQCGLTSPNDASGS